MLKKLHIATTLLLTNLFMLKSKAYAAEGDYALETQDASSLGSKIVELVKTVGMPIGGSILFFSVLIIAVKLIVTSSNAKKRAEAMEGLMYIGIGGIILGAALFLAGALLGIGEALAK